MGLQLQAHIVQDMHLAIKGGTLSSKIRELLETNDADTLRAGLDWILKHTTECTLDHRDERIIREQWDFLVGWKSAEWKPTPVDPKIGIYQHYKGKYYNLMMIGRDTETGADVAIYTPLYCHHEGGRVIQVRPLKMFAEEVTFTDPVEIKMYGGERMPRFRFVGEQLPAAPKEI